MIYKFLSEKLTRDKTLERTTRQGGTGCTRTLTNPEFVRELSKKLLEECHEVLAAKSREELISELADLQEVCRSIAQVNDILPEEIELKRQKKLEDRGGFENKVYYTWLQAPHNSEVAAYCLLHLDKYPIMLPRKLAHNPTTNNYNQSHKEFLRIKNELFKAYPQGIISALHIGSTSLKEAYGQPTIDLLVEVESLLDFDLHRDLMNSLGWVAYGEEETPGRRLFALFNKDQKTLAAQLFCFEYGSQNVQSYAMFTNRLAQSDALKSRYQALKEELLRSNPDITYEDYYRTKQAFIATTLSTQSTL